MAARRLTAGVLAAGSLLAGCGAQAAPNTPPSSSSPAPPATSAKTGLAAVQPCDLLSTVDRSSAGLTAQGKAKTIGTARACDWTVSGVFGLTITLDENTALADLDVEKGTGKKQTIGRHQAIKVSDSTARDGTCAVLLAAGPRASVGVDVSNASFTDTTLACDRAMTVAKLIEPKLP